ncbi:unnamed protein product [Strongylus vulgaris]|uniref:Thioredoxin domain-containing protein n=1 Tax=Strongylus vulgaris TaxID=40348 RepID=A0A3P7LPV7_STRVU|nr:unnamed protein product [Strongylus vulgaris]
MDELSRPSATVTTSPKILLRKKPDADLEKEMKKLNEMLKKDFDSTVKKSEEEIDKTFMNFKAKKESPYCLIGYNTAIVLLLLLTINRLFNFQSAAYKRSMIFSWKIAAATLGVGATCLLALFYIRKIRLEEREKHMKYIAGKARIGGDWELVNTEGKPEGSEQLKGNWLLLYFGFTHCPDICPDEIEKMIEVVNILDSKPEKDRIPIKPIFISVDPERDTPARVKEYCAEFSPKLQGYTGTVEQVNKVAKTFRVYHSQGPRTGKDKDDYIVDHTVITYLIDPDGHFHDYYGQNKTAEEIANIIQVKVLKYRAQHRKNILGF